MNRGLSVFVALATVLAVIVLVSADEKYTDKYDNVNLEEILNNERLYKKYYECMMADTDSHCTADAKELKKAIPDALTNECSKCSERQKNGARTVIKHIRHNKSDDWAKLEAKFDPTGIYRAKYADKYEKEVQ